MVPIVQASRFLIILMHKKETQKLINIRKQLPILRDMKNVTWMTPHNIHVAGFIRHDANKKLFGVRVLPIYFDSNKFPRIDPVGRAIAFIWHLNALAKQRLKDFLPAQPVWKAASETDY